MRTESPNYAFECWAAFVNSQFTINIILWRWPQWCEVCRIDVQPFPLLAVHELSLNFLARYLSDLIINKEEAEIIIFPLKYFDFFHNFIILFKFYLRKIQRQK